MSITAARRNKVAKKLLSQGSVQVGELATEFSVSTETIRKDILYLEKKGVAIKTHGGALIAGSMLSIEQSIERKTNKNIDLKTRIAHRALELIPEKAVIILDSGSTVQCLTELLSTKSGFTIFSNAYNSGAILSQSNNDFYLLGGKLLPHSMAMVGHWANNLLSSIKVDICFIGTDGLLHSSGPCTASYEEAQIKQSMISSSQIRVLLSESSKFNNPGLFQCCDWGEIDYFITDDKISKDYVSAISAHTKVIVVPYKDFD
ncbi:DeoR/GlpR family DNA-binding transcription regulator [Vibrio sp. SA48]